MFALLNSSEEKTILMVLLKNNNATAENLFTITLVH